MTDAPAEIRGAGLWRVNPIWQKCARARLRPRHLISWGVVTVTITLFVALIVYMTMTEQELASRQVAAEAVLPAIVVIQAVLLMMFGTGVVAAGMSQERDEGLIDYQRMTPMSPTAKILGYLFGLPVREYALFAMTLPVVAVAAVVSGFSLLTLAHFYLVFFTSVWVYHLTAMAAGMISPKPRLAQMLSVGVVVVLYFVLPNLSRVGITFFEFLTIRPTFFGLLQQELPEHLRAPAEASGIDSFRDVPFFHGAMHPTPYTLLVQGFLLATMFTMVHRKWRNPAHHVLSKGGALAVYCGVVFFLLASVWAVVVQDGAYKQIFAAFDSGWHDGERRPESLELLLGLFGGIVGVAFLALITAVTASRHTVLEGWRRAAKFGSARLPANSDAASSLPLALAMLAIAGAAGLAVLWQADRGGLYFARPPSAWAVGVLVVSFVGAGLFVQGAREWLSLRVFGLLMFLLWMIPFFTMAILFSAFEAWKLGAHIGLPCPPVLLIFALGEMMQSAETLPGIRGEFLPPELAGVAGPASVAGAVGYGVAGVLAQIARARRRSRLRARSAELV
ncbi:MAG: hypothetical protein IT431_00835 [Phycisphaerales bacterium]|nr:hypothetical protein [Phycisphaerales bacterium]